MDLIGDDGRRLGQIEHRIAPGGRNLDQPLADLQLLSTEPVVLGSKDETDLGARKSREHFGGQGGAIDQSGLAAVKPAGRPDQHGYFGRDGFECGKEAGAIENLRPFHGEAARLDSHFALGADQQQALKPHVLHHSDGGAEIGRELGPHQHEMQIRFRIAHRASVIQSVRLTSAPAGTADEATLGYIIPLKFVWILSGDGPGEKFCRTVEYPNPQSSVLRRMLWRGGPNGTLPGEMAIEGY